MKTASVFSCGTMIKMLRLSKTGQFRKEMWEVGRKKSQQCRFQCTGRLFHLAISVAWLELPEES